VGALFGLFDLNLKNVSINEETTGSRTESILVPEEVWMEEGAPNSAKGALLGNLGKQNHHVNVAQEKSWFV